MSDDDDPYAPSKEQLRAGWTRAMIKDYVQQRNKVSADNIFGGFGLFTPRGRPKRPLVIEKGPNPHQWARGGYSPHDKHRRFVKRSDGY